MSQVDSHHPPREFKFVGGPSRKRRRNAPRLGLVMDMGPRRRGPASTSHQPKRTCPESLSVDSGTRLASSVLPTVDMGGLVMPSSEQTQDSQSEPQPPLETAPFIETEWTEQYMEPFLADGLESLLCSTLPMDASAPPFMPICAAPSPSTSNTSSTDSASNSQQNQTSPESLVSPESPDSSDSCAPFPTDILNVEPSQPPFYIQPSALYDTLTRVFARCKASFLSGLLLLR